MHDHAALLLQHLRKERSIESYGGEDGVLVLKLKDGTRIEASERRAAEVRRRLK